MDKRKTTKTKRGPVADFDADRRLGFSLFKALTDGERERLLAQLDGYPPSAVEEIEYRVGQVKYAADVWLPWSRGETAIRGASTDAGDFGEFGHLGLSLVFGYPDGPDR